ncbi:MAG: phage terminase large subunit family protein [Desulfuromonadales bacterium]|nr:phage terminase large subunit family protein [Desulfuromonadales bacterium]
MQSNTAEQIALVDAPKLPLRPWMPERWRRAVAGQRVTLRIVEPVKRRCKKPKPMTPSELSVKFRRMPSAEGHPGAYRFEFAKHARKVMDTWAKPWVREIWFCGVDQASKTNCMLSCIFWRADQAPGNIFYQMPSAEASDKIMGQKLNPMLRESPRVAVHVSPRADDTSLKMTSLTNGMTILPAHAGSLTSTATFAALDTFSDEIDKMEMVGKEASPIVRIRKRNRTKRFGKNFFASTPGGKYIYKGTMACVQVWEGTARCPFCGELMGMTEEQVIIPDGITADDIKADESCIEYACDKCGELLSETDRNTAYNNIVSDNDAWRCIKGADIAEPVDVGFILSAFPIPDVKLSDIAQTKLKAEAGDLSSKRDMAHGIKAIDYEDDLSDRKEDAILALCDSRTAGLVHPDSDAVTIHIDTQDKGFWYTIRGWQYGPAMTSWLVKAGYVPSDRFDDFSALDKLLFEDKYFDQSGIEYQIGYGIIDSGGHRTGEVYDWCKRTGIFASKGAKGRKAQPVTVSNQEFFPHNNRPIPGGLKLYNLDTHFHKDLLVGKLAIDITDPGAWVLHSGYSEIQRQLMEKSPDVPLKNGLDAYAKHFTVEYRDEKGLWQCPKNKRNDLFDCEQMAIALARYLGFHQMVSEKQQDRKQQQTNQPQSTGSSRPGWFNNRGR